MIRLFKCECGEYSSFEIVTENSHLTNRKNETFFRCSECGKDYQLDEVNYSKEESK